MAAGQEGITPRQPSPEPICNQQRFLFKKAKAATWKRCKASRVLCPRTGVSDGLGCFKLKVYTTGWYHIIAYVCACMCLSVCARVLMHACVCVSVYVCLLNPFLDKLLSPAVTLLRINDSAPFTLLVLPPHKHKQLWRVMGCRLTAARLAIFNIGTQAQNMRDNSLERFIQVLL